MTQNLYTTIIDQSYSADLRQQVYDSWGRLSFSMLTMFEITMAPGAWGKIGRILIFKVSWAYALFFIPYGWIVSFTIIRVITALFLKQTLAAAAVDPEQAMMEKKKKKIRELKHLRALFAHADRDGGGTLSMDEFQ